MKLKQVTVITIIGLNMFETVVGLTDSVGLLEVRENLNILYSYLVLPKLGFYSVNTGTHCLNNFGS